MDQHVIVLAQQAGGVGLLLAGLAKRGAKAHVVTHPAQVMAALAGLKTAVVVVAQPGSVKGLGRLLAAVGKYYPKAACWQYESNGPGRGGALSRLTGAVTLDAAVGKVEPRPAGGLNFREAREAAAETHKRVRPTPRPANGSLQLDRREAAAARVVTKPAAGLGDPALTAEELAMLIGPAFDGQDADDEVQI